MDRWWVNGVPGHAVDVADRGLAYGDGLFETLAVRAGVPRLLSFHLDRLVQGAERLRLPLPDRRWLDDGLRAAADGVAHGVLKLLLTRGTGPRGYAPPAAPRATVAWGIATTHPAPAHPLRVRWCETMASANPATAGLKTLCRLDQVLARAEWRDPAVDEGLMTSTDGWLIGGTAGNVFLVADGRLLTPSVDRAGIAGVMRRFIIQVAGQAGIDVRVGDLSPATVATASELFLSNALHGIRPVQVVGSRQLAPGPVTARLMALLTAAGVVECAG